MIKTAPNDVTASGKLIIGGTSMAWGAELWSWIGTNEPQLTALAALTGATIAVAGFLITLFKDKKEG